MYASRVSRFTNQILMTESLASFFPRAECSQILPFYFTVPKSFLHMRQRKTTSGLEAFFILERQRCVMSFVYHLVIF